ncbi:uncharacterized protein LOC112682844 [Sipha flava]|uniref:Fibroblast growth factor n=1 Tax=Sipha flava TaxID=143950 RepID=A0A2S2QVG5_9HEMI|nr:uncharacterized protein LOC112682844 [Sipha flava]
MVKRSRVYCNSSSSGGGGANRRSVLVTTFRALVLCVLLCGGAVLGSPPGDRSPNAAAMMVPERKPGVGAGRIAAENVATAGSATRSSRSSDSLSHIVGTARKIKMFIRHRYLQLFLDGTVNSTYSDTSDYVILQRTSVNLGQLKIQGVATCMYLCLDACGLLYGSKDFLDECVFNETIEQDHYNTYSSAKYSDDSRTLYLGINKSGLPRQVQVKANAPLGKLSKSTHVLTQPVSQKTVDRVLASRGPMTGEWPDSIPHAHRHHHVCPPHVGPPLVTGSNKYRKSGRKCQPKPSGGGGGGGGGKKNRKKNREEAVAIKDDEDGGGGKKNGGNRCGNDETSHRKADAAGRKKKSKKSTGCGGKGGKSQRLPLGKASKKPEPGGAAVQSVTTVVAPSLTVDEDASAIGGGVGSGIVGGGGDDEDDEDAPATAVPADDETSS